MLLTAYDYDIEFHSTSTHGNANALLCLPLPTGGSNAPSETRLCNIRTLEALPVTTTKIRAATKRDPTLSKVLHWVLKGWPEEIPDSLKPYHSKIAELSVEGCLLWGGRVIIPPSLQELIKKGATQGAPRNGQNESPCSEPRLMVWNKQGSRIAGQVV